MFKAVKNPKRSGYVVCMQVKAGFLQTKATHFETVMTTVNEVSSDNTKVPDEFIFRRVFLNCFTAELDELSCTFCKTNEESLEHLLFFCKTTDICWKEALSWLAIHKNEVVDFALVDVLFGKFYIDKDFIVINHILLLAKFY